MKLFDPDVVFWRMMGMGVGITIGNALFPVDAHAADSDYCHLYSREMVRSWIWTVSAADLPNITVDTIAYRLTQYWAACINRDEEPVIKDLPSDGQWTASIWSDIQRNLPHPAEPQVAHAQPVRPPPPAPAPLRKVAAAAPSPAKASEGQPQPLCLSVHRKTIYTGRSWRCVQ